MLRLRRIVIGGLFALACTALMHAAAAAEASGEDPSAGALPEGILSDRNGDGVLTEDEVMPGMFSLLDANRDGRAEPSEIRRFLARAGRPFSWVNPPSADRALPGLTHATFQSASMGVPVGYNIYLPPGYDSANGGARYPVIYYLHGGRPGDESRTIGLAEHVHAAVAAGSVRPVIMVWPNGGRVSWYDHEDSMGEEVFVRELIPHIDRTYRTVAQRAGRALQGFSQGGRGTTRIMFRYPELFVSAAPGGPGYAVEKLIFENDGVERDTRAAARGEVQALDFGKGNDAYSLARHYAERAARPPLNILVWVGTRGFNYEATLEYLGYLEGLSVPAERLIATGVD
ncbi:MAG: alpha/beta hydrolase-fold protein, partial [Gammaproteobacteria bacterium]|nr:alpha/beta hydrolase-fold protein [Gammaproteobacteria bacterium]